MESGIFSGPAPKPVQVCARSVTVYLEKRRHGQGTSDGGLFSLPDKCSNLVCVCVCVCVCANVCARVIGLASSLRQDTRGNAQHTPSV
jgi:hypothetical protein